MATRARYLSPVPLDTCLIRVARSRLRVRVEIHRTLRDLRRACGANDRNYAVHADTLGACTGVYDDRPVCALIKLSATRLTTGIISHEACHAALRILERRGIEAVVTRGMRKYDPRPARSVEEDLATAVGEITRLIVKFCYDRGHLK